MLALFSPDAKEIAQDFPNLIIAILYDDNPHTHTHTHTQRKSKKKRKLDDLLTWYSQFFFGREISVVWR